MTDLNVTEGSMTLMVTDSAIEFNGKPLRLTPHQEKVLRKLWELRPHIVTRPEFLRELHGENEALVDVHVCNVRRILQHYDSRASELIETVHGLGYRLRNELADPSQNPVWYRFTRGDAEVVFRENGTVEVNGTVVHLNPFSQRLLAFLAKHADRTCTKDMFFDSLYHGTHQLPEQKIFDVGICCLRRSLRAGHADAVGLIETVWGRGYKLVTNERTVVVPDPPASTAKKAYIYEGVPVTIADLPPPDCRWVVRRKLTLLALLQGEIIDLPYVLARYPDLTEDEIRGWRRWLLQRGVGGLKLGRFQAAA